MTIEIPRRKFLLGLIGLIAAPAVVRVASLMPVQALAPEWIYMTGFEFTPRGPGHTTWRMVFDLSLNAYVGEMVDPPYPQLLAREIIFA